MQQMTRESLLVMKSAAEVLKIRSSMEKKMGMRTINIRRKEILCKQMEMLAEKSTLATTDEIVKLSVAMCEIDKRLVHEQTAFMYPQDV